MHTSQATTRGRLRNTVRAHPLPSYLLLAYAISWVAWGDAYLGLGIVGVILGGFGPLIAAWIVTSIEGSTPAWARRIVAWRAPLRFYVYALGLPALLWSVMNLVLAALGEPVRVSLLGDRALVYLGGFVFVSLLGGGFEEPGWRGFALPRLQARHSPLVATLILALFWGLWHLPLYGLGFVGPMLYAFYYTYLYNRTGSVLLCILLHGGFTAALDNMILTADSVIVHLVILACGSFGPSTRRALASTTVGPWWPGRSCSSRRRVGGWGSSAAGRLTSQQPRDRRPCMDIQELVAAAINAPSSHNTQPWIFRQADGGVLLLADRTRALPVNDPEDRELTISCGAALFNLRTAAAAAGLSAKVSLLPDPEDSDLLARIDLEEGHETSDEERVLTAAIDLRYTHRTRFLDRAVPAELVSRLQAAAEPEGSWLQVIADEGMRDRMGDLVEQGDRTQFADPRWRRELAAWMHPRRRGDGLVVPMAPVTRFVVRSFDMGARTGGKDEELAETSPLLAVLGTSSDGVADWLSAGQGLERVLLVAADAGAQASFLNQPCQASELRPRLREVIGTSGVPQVVLRMGYPDENVRRAPRRPVEAVLEVVS